MKFSQQTKHLGVCLALACAAAIGGFNAHAASGTLPPGSVQFSVVAGTNSYAPITFSQTPSGHVISNATYQGWCVQYHVLISKGPVFAASLFDPYAPLPSHLQNMAWDKVNYILNHRLGGALEVQNAIWVVLGQNFDPPWTANSQAMVDAANQLGSGFVPGVGQVKAIIVDPEQAVQRLVCEVLCTEAASPSVSFTLRCALNGNNLICTLEGPSGVYTIERSQNLVSWQPTMTVEITNGSVNFSDSQTGGADRWFYRAVQN